MYRNLNSNEEKHKDFSDLLYTRNLIPEPILTPGRVAYWNDAQQWPMANDSARTLASKLARRLSDDKILEAVDEILWRLGANKMEFDEVITIRIDGKWRPKKTALKKVIKFALDDGWNLSPNHFIRWNIVANLDTKQKAVTNGSLRLFQYLTDVMDTQAMSLIREPGICALACKVANLDVLKWASNNGYPKDNECSVLAASFGNMELLEYVTNNGFSKHPLTARACLWDPFTNRNDSDNNSDDNMNDNRATNVDRYEKHRYCVEHGYLREIDTEEETSQVARIRRGQQEMIGWRESTEAFQLARAQERRGQQSSHHEQRQNAFTYPANWRSQLDAREVFVNAQGSNFEQRSYDAMSNDGTCYDEIELETLPISAYLSQNSDNIVIITQKRETNDIKPKAYATTRSIVAQWMTQDDHVFVPCRSHTLRDVHHEIRIIKVSVGGNFFIPEADLTRLIQEPNVKIWQYVQSSLTVSRTASLTALSGIENSFIGTSHCQDGSDKVLTRIIPISFKLREPVQNMSMTEDQGHSSSSSSSASASQHKRKFQEEDANNNASHHKNSSNNRQTKKPRV